MSLDLTMQSSFENMGLNESVVSVLGDIGFETPTPIQTAAMPSMLAGRDILGQAQTGTGKTAAFAMPILSMIDPGVMKTQALILVPTRELAIQLADAFRQYSSRMSRVNVLPVYGGADYGKQFKSLKNGAHVVVGTPGRVMDHVRRNSLKFEHLKCLVLDEADEMLQMGFIEDITWILEQTPPERQTALFSATLPLPIRRIAQKYMKDPEEIIVKLRTAPPLTINQRYLMVDHSSKIETLCRIIEAETSDGMLVFMRTKVATMELVEQLESRGYAAEALNGDLKQLQRERTVHRFKSGKVDVLVATDVAARGLDVDRISHVINFDVPQDPETYIHRVGRTGRAGRKGEAIIFITYREKRMLGAIERATRQKIALMRQPSAEVINKKRIAGFKEDITAIIEKGDLSFYTKLLSEYLEENDVSALQVAAALAERLQGKKPFLFKDVKKPKSKFNPGGKDGSRKKNKKTGDTLQRRGRSGKSQASDHGMDKYRLEVGKRHGAKEGNIVGAIANEAGLDSQYICKLKMFDKHSTVELPSGMPPEIFQILKRVWVGKQKLNLSKMSGSKKVSRKKQKPMGKKRKKSVKNSK